MGSDNQTGDSDQFPECGGPLTEKGVTVDGNTVAATVHWLYCLDCGWDNRSQEPDSDQ